MTTISATTATTHDVSNCNVAACMSSDPGPNCSTFLEHLRYVVEPLRVEPDPPSSLLQTVVGPVVGLESAKARLQSLLDATRSAVELSCSQEVQNDRVDRYHIVKTLEQYVHERNSDRRSGLSKLFANSLIALRQQEYSKQRAGWRSVESTSDDDRDGSIQMYRSAEELIKVLEARRPSGSWWPLSSLQTVFRQVTGPWGGKKL